MYKYAYIESIILLYTLHIWFMNNSVQQETFFFFAHDQTFILALKDYFKK